MVCMTVHCCVCTCMIKFEPFLSFPLLQEDTKRMIEQLRGRAKVTKDFLQLANHSVED